MIYTHIYDLIGKSLSALLAIFLLKIFGYFTYIKAVSLNTPYSNFVEYCLVALAFVILYLIFYRPYVSVMTTAIYVDLKFKVSATWSQSKELRKLFSLNRKNKWYPMNDVLLLPQEERLEALLNAAKSK